MLKGGVMYTIVDDTKFNLRALPEWMPMAGIAIWPFGVFMKQSAAISEEAQGMLRHEAQHIRDQKDFHVFFWLTYLLLLPIGPSFKAFWEWRAYRYTLYDEYLRLGWITPMTRMHVSRWLSGPLYFWAVSGSYAEKIVNRWCDELERTKRPSLAV
jgi:hypothetical protein